MLGRGDVGTGCNYDDAMGQEKGEAFRESCTAVRETENYQKTVLIISALDFWALGEGKGGALGQTVRGYASRGWRVIFLTGNISRGNYGKLAGDLYVVRFDAPWMKRLMKIRKVGFLMRVAWWVWFQIMAFIKAQRVHSRYRVDLVYGYEICGVPVCKVLSKLWRVPVVSRYQGTLVTPLMDSKLQMLRFWDYLLAYRIPTDLVIMTNDGTQGDSVLESMGVDAKRVRFWMNGIDRERFGNPLPKSEARRRLHLTARYVLLTVSRLVGWKRVERSVNALPEVVRDFPDTLLVVVGEGNQRARLERLARSLSVERHVRFEGGVPHPEIPLYLAAADICLSLYDLSNVGNPLLEAMTAGKCIITLNNGDTERFVRNGDNGVLLEYGSLPQLPSIVKALLADERRREELGANARRFAEENFWTWEKRIDAEVAAISSLLARKSPETKRG